LIKVGPKMDLRY